MKIKSITGPKNNQMIWVEGTADNWKIARDLDLARFVGKDVKALILRGNTVVGVEHNNGSVTGERS